MFTALQTVYEQQKQYTGHHYLELPRVDGKEQSGICRGCSTKSNIFSIIVHQIH